MMRAAGRFLVRVWWTFLWLVENVYVNLLRTSPRSSSAANPGLGIGGAAPGSVREVVRLEEQRQALRLSDIWGRSQRVEHEIAQQQGHQRP
jgi:hypothetical protein